MRTFLPLFFLFVAVQLAPAQTTETLRQPGLREPVEILRDRWGIAHIYARNEHDLFFAQGYVAASDRLFQLELWRRQATGTVAEWLGPQELKRDIGTRLFRFRGNLDEELRRYHPRGPQIVKAFVEGINAYVRLARQSPETLPVEFQKLKTLPDYWTPEVVISRHQGLLGNVRDELNYGRLVHRLGAERLRELVNFHPTTAPDQPDLKLEVDGEALFQPILELYEAFRLPLTFPGPDGKSAYRSPEAVADWFTDEQQYVGSNNWVISGKRAASGYPMLANDPHRAQSVPSLRYWVHLNAPGWNVIGAGEPTLPGVSIGHNEHGAWGLTIFETDSEDLYVYEANPANPNQYRYRDGWESLRIIRDTITVKGGMRVPVELKHTRHGPVVFEDKERHTLYAVRAGWLEAGAAPYLASLRMNQAKSWTEFRQACTHNRIPGENMIWAGRNDRQIGWQAAGISAIRPNWAGLLPVPGDGRFEWGGYLPEEKLPHSANPASGFIATANNNLTPADYPYRNAVGWTWSSPARANRIAEVLRSKPKHTLADFAALQADYLANPARVLIPLLKPVQAEGAEAVWAREQLLGWDFQLKPESVPAAVYAEWESLLRKGLYEVLVPQNARPYLRSLPTARVLEWLTPPDTPYLRRNGVSRDSLLLATLGQTVRNLEARLGPDRTRWQYGQAAGKHIALRHALTPYLSAEEQARINLGPVPRGGYSETVNNTGGNLNQEHGASFRILVDTKDWDQTLGINSPGQSADPRSPYYANLFPIWARNEYVPIYVSRPKSQTITEKRTVLRP